MKMSVAPSSPKTPYEVISIWGDISYSDVDGIWSLLCRHLARTSQPYRALIWLEDATGDVAKLTTTLVDAPKCHETWRRCGVKVALVQKNCENHRPNSSVKVFDHIRPALDWVKSLD